jgi:uncharacterized membrane protein YecN with MAPEG domain
MAPVTAWTTAPLLLLVAALGLRISWLRLSGAARRDEARFKRWQRAHGNTVEHVPLALLALYLVERAGPGTGADLLPVVGGALVVARLLHAGGTAAPQRHAKFTGAALTYLVEIALGGLLLLRLL